MNILLLLKAKNIITKIRNNKKELALVFVIIFFVFTIINYFRLQSKLIDAEKSLALYEEANKELALTISNIESDFQRRNALLEKRIKYILKQNKELDNKLQSLKAIPNEKCLDSPIPADVVRLLK